MFFTLGSTAVISVSCKKTFIQCIFPENIGIPGNDCYMAIKIGSGTTVKLKDNRFELSVRRCNLIDYGCCTHIGSQMIEQC